ncbi:hypothetical protein CFC21_058834 [Triticum aestivum]|uniref:Homeobox-leucine zipper protein n=2 Tax=Triticum aestivum TaxID=4565 RepID=A0A3B6ITG7_WHEAT|nr:homeobox-leucine zipper protein HOX21-like isoform X2 [Triticum dicoccoides]XP_044371183.1 homeobox-leucine zipper protein HOX21 isoform X2 [Triticum aestivum]KAF7050466.1 hypothetical protein CFC21_058834 [Triticum aestivum]
MASNGMASSPSAFFPPNFLLHMQQAPPQHDPQEHHQQHHHHHHEHHLPPPHPQHNPFLPSPQCPSLQDFRGGLSPMLGKRPAMYGGGGDGGCGGDEVTGGGANEEETSDDGSQLGGEKKRRLNVEQVRTLEKNFEVANKLEPERKMQLARALGLQPRQVAIWFQNRRARWKTKQLEKDYDVLKRQFDAVKAENDALLSHNKKLQSEILGLKGCREAASELINLNKETEASCSNRSENSSEINLDISRTPPSDGPMDAPPSHQQGGGGGGMIPFYPSVARPAGVDIDHLLHASVPKMEHHHGGPDTPSFGNLLCGVDEPPPFWPWADHQQFN